MVAKTENERMLELDTAPLTIQVGLLSPRSIAAEHTGQQSTKQQSTPKADYGSGGAATNALVLVFSISLPEIREIRTDGSLF